MTNPFRTALTAVAFGLAALLALSAPPASAQEKHTVFTESDFHWQANLKAGQTLEVIGRNGEVEASGIASGATEVAGSRSGGNLEEAYIEVVEYPEGATICAVYAKDPKPGRCHRGGVNSDEYHGLWHNERAKIRFRATVPRGVLLHAVTTNGPIHCSSMQSIVQASTTNGDIHVSTTEWVSASTTNGSVNVTMGSAQWDGQLHLTSTNGGITAELPASAQFILNASTTNGSIHTDFPITVVGDLGGMKHLSGTVGSGGRDLRLATTNGGIQIHKTAG